MDRHAEHEIDAVGRGDRILDGRLRVERDADAEVERPRVGDRRAPGSSHASTWKVTLSPPAFAMASKWRSGSDTMRWQSKPPSPTPYER